MRAAYKRRARRGQATLEGALVLLLFLGILIGILDLGQLLFVHQMLGERARNAVRYASVNDWSAGNIARTQNLVVYGATDPAPGATPFFSIRQNMVRVERPTPDYSSEDRVVVTVSGYPFEFFSFYIAGLATGRPIVASLPFEITN